MSGRTLPVRALTALVGGPSVILGMLLAGAVIGLVGGDAVPLPNLRSSADVTTPLVAVLPVVLAVLGVLALERVPARWQACAVRPMARYQLLGLVALLASAATAAGLVGGAEVGVCTFRNSVGLLALAACCLAVGGRGSAVTVLLVAAAAQVMLGRGVDGEPIVVAPLIMTAGDPRGLAALVLAVVLLSGLVPLLPSRRLRREGNGA